MGIDRETSRKIASGLLQIKAIQLNPEQPFTWASGWKSPIYCDNRKALSHPELRTRICDGFCELIRQSFPQANVIAGVATAGIAHGALVADRLQLPYIYVRASAKSHGLGNRIEGALPAGARAVLIEDLISTGGSSISAAEALRETDAEVLGLAAIFTYEFPKAAENLQRADLKWETLSAYSSLIDEALSQGYFDASALETLGSWRLSPEKWMP